MAWGPSNVHAAFGHGHRDGGGGSWWGLGGHGPMELITETKMQQILIKPEKKDSLTSISILFEEEVELKILSFENVSNDKLKDG